MAEATQANRPLKVTTPLGADALLLVGFTGTEYLSRLYEFQLDLLRPVPKGPVEFDKLLGQKVGVELVMNDGKSRFFHGIVNKMSQGKKVQLGGDDKEAFIQYRADVVPQVWLATKKTQSRIFQHITVPDILKKVLTGFPVKWDIKGKFQPRDYCVQYRESDFAFASRIMEEEGIFYFFTHAAGAHEMVVADMPHSHLGPAGQQEADLRGSRRRGPAGASASSGGTRSRRSGPARSRCGTTASSCRTSTWTRTRRSPDGPGRDGQPQAGVRRRPEARTVRLPGRVRRPVRRDRQGG